MASGEPQLRLAFYIDMAHGGLLLAILTLYGVCRLLDGYLRPLVWAMICSIQQTIVDFWTETFLAIPIAIFKVFVGTIVDFRDRILLRRRRSNPNIYKKKPTGFSRLLRWLKSVFPSPPGIDIHKINLPGF